LALAYVTLIVVAFSLFVIAAFRKSDGVILSWLATGLFFVLAFASFDQTTPFCERETAAWLCTSYQYVDASSGYLFSGLGLISLIFSFYWTLTASAEMIMGREPTE